MFKKDLRLNSSHNLLEMRLTVKVNDKNWTDKERTEIIDNALKIYTSSKSRKRKLNDISEDEYETQEFIAVSSSSSDDGNETSDLEDL